ncbi:MAG: methyltransferase domain-containing protein [Candidatus Omnitrophica bacterium]|nr:methyltransferase domain-containing protein [Candidatus Omnitrophota bacterium]
MRKSSEIKKIYINGYARTDSKNNSRLSRVLKLVDKTIPRHPQRILDVGCGDGSFTIELGKILKVKEMFGIDISSNAAKEALSRNVKAEMLDVDEGDLPFEANYFDFVFCGSLIECILDPDHLLDELYRVLSPSGHLIITFPNLCSWASRIAILFGFHPYYDLISRRYDLGKLFIPTTKYKNESKGFVRLYTFRSFKQLLNIYGLKIISSCGARESAMPTLMGLFDQLLSKFPSFAFQVICLAVKK